MKKHLPLFLLVFFLICITTPIGADEARVLRVEHRSAAELIPLVEGLLSEGGKVSVDTRTNSLVVFDNKEVIEKIAALVAYLDRPLEQLRVRFRFQGGSTARGMGDGGSGRVSGDGWSVSSGPGGDGIAVRAEARLARQGGEEESFISVMSGGTAYICVGKEVPFRERWIYLTRRYARIVEGVHFERVETGFEVRPTAMGDKVQIEVIPRVSSFARRERVVRLTEAATTITVPRGVWVTIGGTSERSNEVIAEILSYGCSSATSSSTLSLLVE